VTIDEKLKPEVIDEVVIRFAGDSGDGMQLTGNRFTDASAIFGNDLATLPNFPAEIRAPAGTIAGVSSFQVQISSYETLTPGDRPGVLVAMNPAALKANLGELVPGGTLIVNEDAFEERNLAKAGYVGSPLDGDALAAYRVIQIPMTSITLEATKELGVKPRDAQRAKNIFALGLVSWMYTRPVEPTIDWIKKKFAGQEKVLAANIAAFRAGFNFGETAELFDHPYAIAPARLEPGVYRNISGNVATAYGLVAAAQCAKLPLFYASYPITPASDILHELSSLKNFGVRTIQAEDEIAAVGAVVGAAFAGQLAVTATSGPGVDLMAETLGLAVSTELPMLIIDVQRGGPSTGLPTKTEQSDLMLVMYGRHGEAPMPIVAAKSPSHCFEATIEAARIALKYRTPVFLLTDGFLANGAEPWLLPDVATLPDISVPFATEPNHGDEFWPFLRDPETLARPWAIPGTEGLEHRIGGLEKQDGSGNINYEPENHALMTKLRADKIAGIAKDIPLVEVDDPDAADLLVLGWGSTWGVAQQAVRQARDRGLSVAHAHLVHVNPFPSNLGEVVAKYPHCLIPEMNMGQLSRLVRAEYLVDAQTISKVQGIPFRATEIEDAIVDILEGREIS